MTVLTDENVKSKLEAIIGAGNVFAGDDIGEHYRVDVLRKAFMATMVDPEFVKDAKTSGLDVDPIAGDKIAELYRKVYATPADVVAEARRAVGN